MTETVLLNINEAIATITFNRPDHMNSLNLAMAHELAEITEQILHDKNIRAVLIQGAGPVFMAGGDIQYFHQTLDKMPMGVLTIVRLVHASILNLQKMRKPVLACVHGSIAGVGMSMMLAADLVIAGAATKFTVAYNKLGVSPDGGSTYFLPRVVGWKKAAELIMLSEVFTAEKAQMLGLINWVVSEDSLVAETTKIVHKLAEGPTQAFANTKELLLNSSQNNLAQQLELEASSFAQLSSSHDFREGVKGFINKSKPVFSGN